MKKIIFIATILLVVGFLFSITTVSVAQKERVDFHVVIVGATNYISPRLNGISQGVKADVNMATDWLQALEDIGVADVHVTILTGREANYTNTIKAIKNINADSEDVVGLFISSHGGMSGGRRYYVLCDEKDTLWRSDIVKLVNSRGARFNFISTDACSASGDSESFGTYKSAQIRHDVPMDDKQKSAYMSLLYDYKGTFELTAADDLTYAFTAYNGGYFSQALFQTLNTVRSTYTWDKIAEITIKETQKIFKKSYSQGYLDSIIDELDKIGQDSQTPKQLQEPVRIRQEEEPDEEDREDETPFVGPTD
jgi:hypothetical protein